MINNIIWDFDGTLFDTYPGGVYAFKKALEDVNIMVKEEEILNNMKISVTFYYFFIRGVIQNIGDREIVFSVNKA